MSKGGGGGGQQAQPTSQTVNQSSLPEYAEPYFTRLMDRTEAVSNEPYIPYSGQRQADLSADTQAGFQQLRDVAQAGTPEAFTTAEGALTGAAQLSPEQQSMYASLPSYSDSGVAQQFMNPYITNVLDAQKARMDQRFAEQQIQRDAQARAANAFGSGNTRRYVQDMIADRERNMQMNEVEAQGLAAAYQSGADIFGQEQGRELQTRGLNTEIFAGNQQRAIDAARARTSAAEQLRAQGIAGDELAMSRGKTLTGIGGILDDRAQSGLDIAYSDFINQRDYPRQQLNFYSGIMRGVPVTPQQEITTFNAPPSQLSQLLGLGVGGLGLAKAFG
jgi:hypothetical protein